MSDLVKIQLSIKVSLSLGMGPLWVCQEEMENVGISFPSNLDISEGKSRFLEKKFCHFE